MSSQKPTNKEYNNSQRKLGVLHSLLLRDVRKWLDEKAADTGHPRRVHLYDIRAYVENRIHAINRNKFNKPYAAAYSAYGFPVGVNVNDVAAHYSPRDWEDKYLDLDKDSVSIDFGMFDPGCGVITDGAFTWNAKGNHIGQQLTSIATAAVDTIIKKSGPDAILGELGQECQEFISSQEVVIEGVEKSSRVNVLQDLCGHKIAPYVVHAGKAVPSIGLPQYKERMVVGETYAVEVFTTDGSGESYEVSLDEEVPSHLSLTPTAIKEISQPSRKPFLAKMMQVLTTRRTVPFHPDWYGLNDEMVMNGVKEHVWKAYPSIKTKDSHTVCQWEKMIRIESSGNKLLLQA